MEVIFDSGATYTYFALQPYHATLSVVCFTLQISFYIFTPIWTSEQRTSSRTHVMWLLQVKSTLSKECKFLTEVKEKDRALTVCWKGKDKIRTIDEVKKCFRSLSLKFADGDKKATLEIPPEHYLIISVSIQQLKLRYKLVMDNKSLKEQQLTSFVCLWQQEGHVCLGILDGSKEHPSLAGTNLIGGMKFRHSNMLTTICIIFVINISIDYCSTGITMLDQMVIYDSERSLLGWVNYQCDRIPRSASAITSRLWINCKPEYREDRWKQKGAFIS